MFRPLSPPPLTSDGSVFGKGVVVVRGSGGGRRENEGSERSEVGREDGNKLTPARENGISGLNVAGTKVLTTTTTTKEKEAIE